MPRVSLDHPQVYVCPQVHVAGDNHTILALYDEVFYHFKLITADLWFKHHEFCR